MSSRSSRRACRIPAAQQSDELPDEPHVVPSRDHQRRCRHVAEPFEQGRARDRSRPTPGRATFGRTLPVSSLAGTTTCRVRTPPVCGPDRQPCSATAPRPSRRCRRRARSRQCARCTARVGPDGTAAVSSGPTSASISLWPLVAGHARADQHQPVHPIGREHRGVEEYPPPIEQPTSVARSTPSSSSRCSRSWPCRTCSGGSDDSPYPRWSHAMTRSVPRECGGLSAPHPAVDQARVREHDDRTGAEVVVGDRRTPRRSFLHTHAAPPQTVIRPARCTPADATAAAADKCWRAAAGS